MGDPLSPDERRHFEEVAWHGAETGDPGAIVAEIVAALEAPLTRQESAAVGTKACGVSSSDSSEASSLARVATSSRKSVEHGTLTRGTSQKDR